MTSCCQGRDLRDPMGQHFLNTKETPPQLLLWLDREAIGCVESVNAHCYIFTCVGQGSVVK